MQIDQVIQAAAKKTYEFVRAYLLCEPQRIAIKQAEYKAAIAKLKAQKAQEGLWAWLETKYNQGRADDAKAFLQGCQDVTNFKKSVAAAYEFVNDYPKVVNALETIVAKSAVYLKKLSDTDKAINRHMHGKIVAEIATLFTPAVVAKAQKLSAIKEVLVLIERKLPTFEAQLEKTIARRVSTAGNYIKFLDDPVRATQFADEIIDINRATEGGGTLLSGTPSSAINTASYYSTVPEEGASIFKTIIKNHMFADGNKRTAVNMFKSFCSKSGIKTSLTDAQMMEVATKVATNQIDDVLEISQQLIK